MHKLVPQFILDNLAAGLTDGKLLAAGLFVDTSGFSTMTDVLMKHGQHGAEILANVMNATFEPFMRSVFEQGGFVLSQEGDAFTALFPVEEDPGETAFRALAAAYQIQETASRISHHDTPYGTFCITVRVGLGFGDTRWQIITYTGTFQSNHRQKAVYYFHGPAIDSCIQAEQQAKPGTIVLYERFYQLVEKQASVTSASSYFYRLLAIQGEIPATIPVVPSETHHELAKNFYPDHVIETHNQGEFRHVTYLFVSLPAVHDDDALIAFMQAVFELQELYDGVLELSYGDKGLYFNIIWGASISFENDIERALSFIMELQSRTLLPVSGGVTHRIAHVGFIGSPWAESFCAFGRGANLAARFMTGAPRGEIWVDEPVFVKTQWTFEFKALGERGFKGFEFPEKVYILVDHKEQPEVIYEGKLVGRNNELKCLDEFLLPICQGKYAGVMIVYGEPGLGKSRLVYEFVQQLPKRASITPQVFMCQCDEIVRRPFNPFRHWLRNYFHVSEAQGDSRNKRNFTRSLDELIAVTQDQRLTGEIERTRSFLGALIDLYWADSLYEQVDAQMRFENTLSALVALLQAESLRQPVLLVVEDVHLMDKDTRSAFPRLIHLLHPDRGKNYPVAVLATSRTGTINICSEGESTQELFLQPLDRQMIGQLIASIVENDTPGKNPVLSTRLTRLLESRSEGNPFFAGQIFAFLKQEGLIKKNNTRWDISANQSFTLPSDISMLLVAQLDHLVEEVRNVVQTASILGREFEIRLLASMMNDTDTDQIPLEVALAEREAIWSRVDEMRYVFKHDLMREAAYQMQLHTRRGDLHARALKAYENCYRENPKDHYNEMAYHADQAGMIDQAIKYLELAGNAAKESYQNGLAVTYYSRALELTASDSLIRENNPGLICHLIVEREDILTLLGNQEERRDNLAAMDLLLSQTPDPAWSAEIYLRKASFALDTGEYVEAFQFASQAIQFCNVHEPTPRDVQGYHYKGIALLRQSKMVDAEQQIRQGLGIARKLGNPGMVSGMLNTLGMTALGREKLDLAAQYFEESLANARLSGRLRDQALPLNNLGMISGWKGDLAAARNYYQLALDLAQKTGDKSGEGLVLGNLGYITGLMGDFSEARRLAQLNIHIAREAGDRMSETIATINLSSFLIALGDLDAAIQSARYGQLSAHSTGDRSAEAWAQTYLGHALLATHDLLAAREAYQAALNIRCDLSQVILATEPAAGLGRIALHEGNLDQALDYIYPIIDHIEKDPSLAGTDDPLQVLLTCYLALKQKGDPQAKKMLQTAYEQLQTRTAFIAEKHKLHEYLDSIPHYREIIFAWQAEQ